MIEAFDCPENKGTTLKIDKDEDYVMVSVLPPWNGNLRDEYVVCIPPEQLEYFKKVVADL